MVGFRRSSGMKPVDEEWHRRREEARREGFNLEQFSESEITRWDLETARITGQDNRLSYLYQRPIDTLHNSATECEYCSGEFSPKVEQQSGYSADLNALDPDDLGLSAQGERPQGGDD